MRGVEMNYVTCPDCGFYVSLSKYGKIRRHAAARGAYAKRGTRVTASDANICRASGFEFEIAKKAFDTTSKPCDSTSTEAPGQMNKPTP
jgi:hypothetical protein